MKRKMIGCSAALLLSLSVSASANDSQAERVSLTGLTGGATETRAKSGTRPGDETVMLAVPGEAPADKEATT